jgi:hypothetical protein
MQDGEEVRAMPPNSTQNLNAKLSLTQVEQQRSGARGANLRPRSSRGSASQTKIVGGPGQYRGGYHLNV